MLSNSTNNHEFAKGDGLLFALHSYLDCKTVRIFAYSSTREQSNKRSGMRLKTESEARVRLLRHALPISLLILRKKPTVFQSTSGGDMCRFGAGLFTFC